jgi:hypothetical protein
MICGAATVSPSETNSEVERNNWPEILLPRAEHWDGQSASGHFTGTPARCLHAHGAVAPDDCFRVRGLGGITRFRADQHPPRM